MSKIMLYWELKSSETNITNKLNFYRTKYRSVDNRLFSLRDKMKKNKPYILLQWKTNQSNN